jgi:predicted RNA-binding protein with PIN domain
MSGFAEPTSPSSSSAVRTLIVDGYNVIRQTPPYCDLAENDLDSARAALVSDVAAFAHGEWRATVVFDGHLNQQSTGVSHEVGGVTVIFSRCGIDADSVIESLARVSRERNDEATVVTSDAQTQWTVLGGTVARMSSAEFSGELRQGSREWVEHAPAGDMKGRLEDRIAADTKQRMWRWARGLD